MHGYLTPLHSTNPITARIENGRPPIRHSGSNESTYTPDPSETVATGSFGAANSAESPPPGDPGNAEHLELRIRAWHG
jgi:hypothetical protein